MPFSSQPHVCQRWKRHRASGELIQFNWLNQAHLRQPCTTWLFAPMPLAQLPHCDSANSAKLMTTGTKSRMSPFNTRVEHEGANREPTLKLQERTRVVIWWLWFRKLLKLTKLSTDSQSLPITRTKWKVKHNLHIGGIVSRCQQDQQDSALLWQEKKQSCWVTIQIGLGAVNLCRRSAMSYLLLLRRRYEFY